jgi:hypothetical protein
MKVILKSVYCSPKGTYPSGATIEVDEFEAEQLIGGGYATPAPLPKPEPVVETAEPVIETEKSVAKTRKRK